MIKQTKAQQLKDKVTPILSNDKKESKPDVSFDKLAKKAKAVMSTFDADYLREKYNLYI